MSKRLYPKPITPRPRPMIAPRENLEDRPYHVEYSDPDNPTATPEWKHYNSELAVKVDAWYQCRFLGFNTSAVLYSREELRELSAPTIVVQGSYEPNIEASRKTHGAQ